MKKIIRHEPYWNQWIFMHNGNLRKINGDLPFVEDIELIKIKKLFNPQNGLSAPTVVQIQFTNRCNLACPHCYVNSGTSLPSEMSEDQIKNLLINLREYGVLEIQWSGGEVFSRKSFLEIVQYSKELGFENSVLTNGYAIGKLPDKFPPEILWSLFTRFQISMDGFEDHFNDWVSSTEKNKISDAWKNVSEGIFRLYNYLENNNLFTTKQLSLTTTLDERNISDLTKIAKLFSGKKINWKLAKQIQNGRSNVSNKNAMEVLVNTYPVVKKLRKEYDLTIVHPFDKEVWVEGILPVEWQTESGARWVLYISAMGDAYPFPYFDGVKKFNAGNVLKMNIDKIWNSPAFDLYRNAKRENTGCLNCPLICQMWARSFNYFESEDIFTSPPNHVNCYRSL